MYFLASTNIALGSGWANTSAMTSDETYAAYVVNLDANDDSPFKPKSDEEEVKDEEASDDKKDKKEDADKKKEDAGLKINFTPITTVQYCSSVVIIIGHKY